MDSDVDGEESSSSAERFESSFRSDDSELAEVGPGGKAPPRNGFVSPVLPASLRTFTDSPTSRDETNSSIPPRLSTPSPLSAPNASSTPSLDPVETLRRRLDLASTDSASSWASGENSIVVPFPPPIESPPDPFLDDREDAAAAAPAEPNLVSSDFSAPVAVLASSSFDAVVAAVSSLHRLDDFVRERIAAGFFSQVFKVTHKLTKEVMVLKLNTNKKNRPNALKETQLLKQMHHPNILRFVGVCVDDGQLHPLTEFINGGNLEQMLLDKENHVHLPWRLRSGLVVDISRGMAYLHSRGIFHRDLTSKNVLVRKEETTPAEDDIPGAPRYSALVGDFGLAAKISTARSSKRLATVGTAYWMAPECLVGEPYDEKVDVFSFGIIVCQTVGRIEADPDVLIRTQEFALDTDAFLSTHGVGAPPFLLDAAVVCCSFDPKRRPSFVQVVETLDSAPEIQDDGFG